MGRTSKVNIENVLHITAFYYNITVFKLTTAMIESFYSWLILAYFWQIFYLLHNGLTDRHQIYEIKFITPFSRFDLIRGSVLRGSVLFEVRSFEVRSNSRFGPFRGSVIRGSVTFEVRSFEVRSYSRFSHSRYGHSRFGLSTFSLSRFGLSRFGLSRFGLSRFGHGFSSCPHIATVPS
jgi:hypothetical protein